MERLANGDRAAFDPLFDRLWPVLRSFVLRQGVEEDVAQRALLNVFERAAEFDSRLDALAWAFGIAAWEVRSERRKVWRRREHDLHDRHLDGAPSPESAVMASELRTALSETLGALRAADLETVMAMAAGERPSGATFRKRLERALSRLRLLWSAKHG
jgi:RNA polymerase sigma-70 factor (ECF subfamily)